MAWARLRTLARNLPSTAQTTRQCRPHAAACTPRHGTSFHNASRHGGAAHHHAACAVLPPPPGTHAHAGQVRACRAGAPPPGSCRAGPGWTTRGPRPRGAGAAGGSSTPWPWPWRGRTRAERGQGWGRAAQPVAASRCVWGAAGWGWGRGAVVVTALMGSTEVAGEHVTRARQAAVCPAAAAAAAAPDGPLCAAAAAQPLHPSAASQPRT